MNAIEITFILCCVAIALLCATLIAVHHKFTKRESAFREDIERLRSDVSVHVREHKFAKVAFHDAARLVTAYQDAFDALIKHDLPIIVTNTKTIKLIDDSLRVRIAEAHRKNASER